jgi:threonyl-tRNA synthetase
MLHRVILGALERFIGVLIEHYDGAFPAWLAPVQAVVLTVTDRQIDYARGVLAELMDAGLRAEGDFRNEKLGLKIREAQMQKIPYMLIIGDKEVSSHSVTVRLRNGENLSAMPVNQLVAIVQDKCRNYQ